jgi:hypothetical protein
MHRVIIKAEISYSDILAIDDGKVRCKKATILGRCDLEGKLI